MQLLSNGISRLWCRQRVLGFLVLVRISLPPTFDPNTRYATVGPGVIVSYQSHLGVTITKLFVRILPCLEHSTSGERRKQEFLIKAISPSNGRCCRGRSCSCFLFGRASLGLTCRQLFPVGCRFVLSTTRIWPLEYFPRFLLRGAMLSGFLC